MLLTLLYLNKYARVQKVDRVAAYLSLVTQPLLYLEKIMLTSRTAASVVNFYWKRPGRNSHLTVTDQVGSLSVKNSSLGVLSLSILNRFN